MKPLAILALSMSLFGCVSNRDFQAEVTDAKLIKIDVITRYPSTHLKMLTRITTENVQYITYEPVNSNVMVAAT